MSLYLHWSQCLRLQEKHGCVQECALLCYGADDEDEEQTLDRRRSLEPNAQPSALDHEAAEALAFNRKPPGVGRRHDMLWWPRC